jgi:hypothetical protein
MTKEQDKPPFWDYERFKKEYVKFSPAVYAELERFAAEKPEETWWYNNFFDGYLLEDFYLDFDGDCELLPDEIRRGQVTHINCRQLKEILRCNYIYEKVIMIATTDAEQGLRYKEDHAEINARLIAHPLWKKMAAQSRKTLELLRIKE